MATRVDISAGTNITASQMMEFHRLSAVSGSHVNRVTFQAYLERRDPFAFERNEHGHVVMAFLGLDLAGATEVERLVSLGYRVSEWAKSCLLSARRDSYDKLHRLEVGRIYRVALMPGREIESDADRTTANLRKRGMEHYGYGKPLAGLVPRIRENLSDKQMEELDIWYAAALHDPIIDSDGGPYVLDAGRDAGGRWVYASFVLPDFQWNDLGLFAFPLLAS